MNLRSLVTSLVALPLLAHAADALTAAELAAGLSAKQEGGSLIRMRMESPAGGVLQLQIKSRVSRSGADLLYQVLFPKERKGEAVLLRRAGGRVTGTIFRPPDRLSPIEAGQLDGPLLGGDLSYEDVIDDFFAWPQQSLAGTEVVDRTECQILESRPGKGTRSSYASVRTWVDVKRLVPLRIEKYGEGGKVVRRINVTRLLLDGSDSLPASLSIRGPRGTVTELDGSRIKRGMTFTDAEFSPESLKKLSAPSATPE